MSLSSPSTWEMCARRSPESMVVISPRRIRLDLAAKLRLVHEGPRRVNGRGRIDDLEIDRIGLRLKGFYQELCSTGSGAATRGTGVCADTNSAFET